MGKRANDGDGCLEMTNFERAISTYITSTRHCPSIDGHAPLSVHVHRRALLRDGKSKQAAAIKRAFKHDAANQKRLEQERR